MTHPPTPLPRDNALRSVRLRVTNHDRDSAGLTYVYPVVSRRAGGVSLGVNLNPNNACNFRCIYCQVPGLTFGKGPPIDLTQLHAELQSALTEILHGDFLETRVDPDCRRLVDIALSGNGEPTTSPQFQEAVQVIEQVLDEFSLRGAVKTVLITNGTRTDAPQVIAGLRKLASLNGEVWFKLDSATREGAARINDTQADPEQRFERLKRVAQLCPTWIQTCVFALDGMPPPAEEQSAYLELLSRLVADQAGVRGVLLYGLARPSLQPEASRLSRLPAEWLEAFAQKIDAAGLPVIVTP